MKQIFQTHTSRLLLCLLFALTGGGNFAWGADETIVFKDKNLVNGSKYSTINGSTYGLNFSLSFGDGSNDGKYYDTGNAIRVYGGGHMTVTSEKTITKVELTFGSSDGSNTITTDIETYTNGTWEGSAKSITFNVGGSSGHRRIASVAVTYEDAPSFTLTATSNNDAYGTVSVSGSTITATPAEGYRVSTTTPYEVTSGDAEVTQNGNTFSVDADADCTVQINFEAIPTYAVTIAQTAGGTLVVKNGEEEISDGTSVASGTVLTIVATPSDQYNFTKWTTVVEGEDPVDHSTSDLTYTMTEDPVTISATFTAKVYANAVFSVNGSTYETVVTEVGQSVEFPANPSDREGKTFVGWVDEAIEGVTDTAPESYVTSATMVAGGLTFYAVFADVTPGNQTEKEDVLNREVTGVTSGSSSYSNWSGKTVEDASSAVYAGNSAGSNNSIQLRSNSSNSGIVTTTSGGYAKKVVVAWNENTSAGRTINVYGKNEEYSAASELYSSSTQGTLLGTIVKGTSTILDITGDYEYIGIRSSDGALYMSSITITWVTGTPDTYSGYCTTLPVSAPTFGTPEGSFNAAFSLTLSCATEGATIYYTTDGTTPTASSTEYTAPIAIPAATTTVKAIAIKGGISSEVASATYTYVSKETPTFSLSDTELDLKVNEDGEITLTTNSDGTVTFTCEDANVTIDADDNYAIVSASATGTYTVTVSVAESENYLSASGNVTVNVTKYATTTAIDASGITNTDRNNGTEAGSLSATVTPEGKSALASPAITWTSSDETVATVDAEGAVTLVATGTTTITASYAGDEENEASSGAYELTVVDTGVTLWSEYFTGYAANAVPATGLNAVYSYKDGDANTKTYTANLAEGTSPELLVARSGGYFSATLKDMQFCYGTLTLSFRVNKSTIGVTAKSNDEDLTVTGTVNAGDITTLTFTLPDDAADLSITFTTTSTDNVRLDNIVLRGSAGDTYYRNVTAGNFGTICLPRAATDLSGAGATFYEVAGTTASGLMLSEVDELAAGTPYVFKATASKLSVPVTGDATTVQAATGLVGNMSTTPVSVTSGNYVLSNNQLRQVTTGTATIGQYRAYFDLSGVGEFSGSEVKSLVLGMDVMPDGISGLAEAQEGQTIYDLSGRRVEKAQKGVYIINGKKVLK